MASDAPMTAERPAAEQPAAEQPTAEQPAAEQPAAEHPAAAAERSPAQPKKPAGGAFGRFLAASRAALTEECKGQPITAVTKLASERFKQLSEEDKAEWQKKFVEAKEQYEKDLEAFKAAGGTVQRAQKSLKRKGGKSAGEDEGGKSAKKRKTDPNAPKKPVGGAYGCFLAKNRSEFQKSCEGQPPTAVSKLAAEKWKALGEEDRKPFQEEYEKNVAAYKEAMKGYTPPEQPAEAARPRLSKLAKAKKGKNTSRKAQKDPAAPKKPVGGSYGRFVAKHRAEFQKECAGKAASAVSKLAGDKWKTMSDEDKKPYQDEYEKQVELYKEAMRSYTPPPPAPGASGPQTPAKKPRASKGGAASDKKPAAKPKAKGPAKGRSKAAALALSAIHLDAGIAEEAEKAGFTSTLLRLAGLTDVAACGKSQADMLKALQESGGLLHPARRALLGA